MATVFKRNDPATGKPKKGAHWIMKFKNEKGVWSNKTSGITCKQTAQTMANKLETEAARRKAGLVDAAAQSVAEAVKRPIREHLDSYETKMKNAGLTEQHVSEQMSILNAFVKDQAIKSVSKVNQDLVQNYIATLRDMERSNRTLQKHIGALRTFFEWMISVGKLSINPTKGIKKPSPTKDRRHERRMLTREEWSWLASVTKAGLKRLGVEGNGRYLLYWTAIETGYRSNELRQVTKSDLGTSEGKHSICLNSGETKNDKSAKQYISVELAIELSKHLTNSKKAANVFEMPSASNVVEMLRGDLKAAREAWINEAEDNEKLKKTRIESDFLKYQDDEGLKLDFHAFRHTCGAWLIIAGVDVKTVQTIMRHSSPTLTLNTYGHLMEGAEARAVETLNAAPHQICTKLSATDEILDAAMCTADGQKENPETKKDLGKTKVFASSCETMPVSASAPPVGLEPTTNGLTVRCSTN